MSEKKTDQELKKSVDETVNQILAAGEQPAAETAQKSMPESNPANGGEDKIHSGSPMSEEQKAEEAKKAKEAEEKEKQEKEEEAKKAMSDAEAKKKAEQLADHEDKEMKDKKMKKSIEELSSILDEDELELIKSWREECEKDAMAKSQAAAPAPALQLADIEQVLKKAVAESTADLKKAIDEKDTLIKSLTEKFEKIASQPAYDRRSISNLETLEKSGAQASGELTKSQILDKMLELQAAGKGVNSQHIAEFEATRNISDPMVRGIVFRELKLT